MSYGLHVLNQDGTLMLDPGSFTIRLIDVIQGPGGTHRGILKISAPLAQAGMIAVAVPTGDYAYLGRGIGFVPVNRQQPGNMSYAPLMPAVRVETGFIELFSPSGSAQFSSNFLIYLYADS